MEDKVRAMQTAFDTMTDDMKGASGLLYDVKSLVQDLETRMKSMENNLKDLEAASKHLNTVAIESEQNKQREIDAAFDKGKQFAVTELSESIRKDRDDARNEFNAAFIKIKEEARMEMEAAVIKAKEDTIKELTFALAKSKIPVPINHKAENAVTTQLPTMRPSEADCSTSFGTICEELIRHTASYLRTLNHEYRVEISNVSGMLTIHELLYSFLFGKTTDEFGKSDAQDIIKGLVFKEGIEISPTTITVLHKAFRLLGPGQFSIEYRALPKFLVSCDTEFKGIIAKAGYMTDDHLVKLVQTALERQIVARGYLHGWEDKVDATGGSNDVPPSVRHFANGKV